jgi:predicted helicase
VLGSMALVGSSNFTVPGLTDNVELNIQVRHDVEILQRWYEDHWDDAEDISPELLKVIERHTREYSPFEVYAKALQEYFRGHELTVGDWEKNQSAMYWTLDQYQREGYQALMKIARQHRGAFLCDGVGLGKTFVGMMLIERLVEFERKRVVLFTPKAARFRRIVLHPAVVWRTREKVMQHILAGQNLSLITPKQNKGDFGAYVTEHVGGHKTVSAYDVNYYFPLYLYPSDNLFDANEEDRKPNLTSEFVEELSGTLALSLVSDGQGDLRVTFGPEDVFHYAYAVFHSRIYRERYAEFLKRDFPRLPLTADLALFSELCQWGEELVSLHLMRAPYLNEPFSNFPKNGSNMMEKAKYDPEENRVYINKEEQYFDNVPEEIWTFRVGGYQVLDKWLKDRKGRTLTAEDIEHYRKVVAALHETRQIMQVIDEVIEAHGGWPLVGSVDETEWEGI